MKKSLTLAIALILVSALVLPVSAAEADYDEAELYSTLKDSFDFYTEFFLVGEEGLINSADTPIIIERDDGAIWPSNTYYPRTDELGDWHNFCDKLHSYYTDEIGDIFIKNMRAFENSDKVYIQSSLCHPQTNDGPFFSYHDTVGEYDIDLETRDTFKLVRSDGNTLLYEFQVFDFWIGQSDISNSADRPSPEEQLLDLTVEFTHTESGWRISGGTVVDTYLYGRSYDYYLNGAPQTSLKTAVYAAVAVVSASVAVVIGKKRR